MIRTAYLRVYLPKGAGDSSLPGAIDHPPHIVRTADRFLWQESTANDALTTVWRGRAYACPRFPRLRMLEGVIAFNRAYPVAGLLPERTVRTAADELARIRSASPRARSHILSSPWHVPLRWFSAFDPETRELYDAPFGLSIRYRGDVGDATERVTRAVSILEQAGFDDSVVAQVRDLERWLRDFSRNGMLELDYGTVAELFSQGDLVLDESAVEVHDSLGALAASDFERASMKYGAVATRWAPAQALTYVN
ncbi:MAG: hypothetical protein ACE5GC_09875 [Acidimicrobiia bacterium]